MDSHPESGGPTLNSKCDYTGVQLRLLLGRQKWYFNIVSSIKLWSYICKCGLCLSYEWVLRIYCKCMFLIWMNNGWALSACSPWKQSLVLSVSENFKCICLRNIIPLLCTLYLGDPYFFGLHKFLCIWTGRLEYYKTCFKLLSTASV